MTIFIQLAFEFFFTVDAASIHSFCDTALALAGVGLSALAYGKSNK